MSKFETELKKKHAILFNDRKYYHVTKSFINKWLPIFENVNSYHMIKLGKRKGYMNNLYVSFDI